MYGRRSENGCAVTHMDAWRLNASLGFARVTAANSFLTEQIYAVQKELVTVMGRTCDLSRRLDRYVKDGFSDLTGHDRSAHGVVDDWRKTSSGIKGDGP